MYLFAEQTPKKRSRTQDSGPASFFYHCIPFQPKNGGVPKIRSHQYHINSSDCHVECNYDLACPVYISDPRNHSECLSLSPMASTAAVREHVETAHRRPFYCPICGTTFATGSEADTHIQERRCAVRDILVGEIRGVPEDTMDQLSGWELQPTLSEEEQWYIMWNIMFPGIPGPATPHMSRDTATHSERRTPRAGIRG